VNVPVEGDVLAGKYRVERVLGKGGMGVVVAAKHLQLGQRVAIKFLLENASADIVSRFIREARAAVRLRSEHAARVLDVGDLPDGAPFMVMEYLEGNDLSHLVRSHGALPIADAVLYLLHACEAMAEAHSIGIIHRDLKPANLFLTRGADASQTIKVLDFGISKTLSDEPDEMALTKSTSLLGSPLYMSPEQLRSAREVTVQSDIWSLGAILYQLLVGAVPFDTRTFSELIMMVNIQPPPPMATLREGIPPGLEAAALRCLEKSPGARFANVGELAWAIAEYGPPEARASAEKSIRTLEAAGIQVERRTEKSGAQPAPPAPAPVPVPASASEPATATASTQQRSAPSTSSATLAGASTPVTASPRPRGPLVMVGAAISVALVVTAVSLSRRSSSPAPEPHSASPASAPASVIVESAPPPPPLPPPTATASALAGQPSASAAPEPPLAPKPAPPSKNTTSVAGVAPKTAPVAPALTASPSATSAGLSKLKPKE
jgi:eukaryotic-like serine/threonine-protein kinase